VRLQRCRDLDKKHLVDIYLREKRRSASTLDNGEDGGLDAQDTGLKEVQRTPSGVGTTANQGTRHSASRVGSARMTTVLPMATVHRSEQQAAEPAHSRLPAFGIHSDPWRASDWLQAAPESRCQPRGPPRARPRAQQRQRGKSPPSIAISVSTPTGILTVPLLPSKPRGSSLGTSHRTQKSGSLNHAAAKHPFRALSAQRRTLDARQSSLESSHAQGKAGLIVCYLHFSALRPFALSYSSSHSFADPSHSHTRAQLAPQPRQALPRHPGSQGGTSTKPKSNLRPPSTTRPIRTVRWALLSLITTNQHCNPTGLLDPHFSG
jgi:hypothetical protein